MKKSIIVLIFSTLLFFSCEDKVHILAPINSQNNSKIYFLSSEAMGPNTNQYFSDFQKKNQSFYINDKNAIDLLKKIWVYDPAQNFDYFVANYYVCYTENNEYRGQIMIDLEHNLAISGFGPSLFNSHSLDTIQNYIKPLNSIFFEFFDLNQARNFYAAIKDKNWLLPTPNANEYYKWVEFDGECIIQVNNKKFARDKDIQKAFDKYMPLKFPNQQLDYNIFKFTSENSSVRICSNQDLTNQFPEEFHIIIPWKRYDKIIIPLINFNKSDLDTILSQKQINHYQIIDHIE